MPDEIGDGQPRLAGVRGLYNHVVFVVADEARVADMHNTMTRRLALQSLLTPTRLGQSG